MISKTYKKLGQYDYGKDSDVTDIQEYVETDMFGWRSIYIGQVKEGTNIKDGIGIRVWEDGNIYEGYYKNELMHGHGRCIMSNGDYYIGGYCNGAMQGQAEYHWANGRVYIGQYFDGHIHGKGTMINPDGTKKTGEWKKEKFVGKTSVTN